MAAVLHEIKPILWEHWAEVAHYTDIPLEPNWPQYEAMEAGGLLRIYTVRDQCFALIGYCIYVVAPGLHYASITYANQDILYLSPEHRRGRTGRNLLRFTELELKGEFGRVLVLQHVKVAHNFGPMLVRDGYEPIDTIYGKRL